MKIHSRVQPSALVSGFIPVWAGLALAALAQTPAALAQETAYQYDELGRLQRVDYPDGKTSLYELDAAGNRTSVITGGLFLGADAMNAAEATWTDFDPLRNDTALSGNPVTLVSVTNGALGTAAVVNGGQFIRYTAPAVGGDLTDTITYTTTDGVIENTGTIAITIKDGSTRPTATDDTVSTNEDVAKTIAVRANDAPNDLAISYVTSPAHGTAMVNAGSIVYTPPPNYFGSDAFTYAITNGTIEDIAIVNVTVNSVNDAPVAGPDAITVTEDVAYTFDPRGNDTDVETPGSLTITAKTNGTKGTAAILNSGAQLRYTPNPNATGADNFTYTIADAGGATGVGTVSVSIIAVNDPPNAVNDLASTNEDVVKTFSPLTNDTDVDGDTLTIASKTNGSKGSVAIVNSSTQLKYTPNANANGSDSFTYTISDGAGGADTATVNMTIVAVNDPPVAVNDVYNNVPRNVWTTLYVQMNDSDADGDALTITSVSGGSGSKQIINAGGAIRYKPATSTGVQDSFTYVISDGAGGTASATVTVFMQATGGGGGGGQPPGPG